MAQFLTLLPVLLLVAVFNPIVCPSSQMYTERRDREIESGDHSPQYLSEPIGPLGSRLRKLPPHKDNNANYRSQEHLASSQPNSNEAAITDSIVDKNIRSVFSTNFGPGLHLFKDKIETSPTMDHNHNHRKDSGTHFSTEEPDSIEYSHENDISDCVEKEGPANGKTFCTNVRNYPEKTHLEQLIKSKFPNLEAFFNEDLVLPQNISQRMNNEPTEEFLCRSRMRVIYPQSGENKDYSWLVIVNTPSYKQAIRIEECINEGSICGETSGISLPNRYTATCKQSYIYRSLVAYTNETVIKDQFRLPSCCKCVLKAV